MGESHGAPAAQLKPEPSSADGCSCCCFCCKAQGLGKGWGQPAEQTTGPSFHTHSCPVCLLSHPWHIQTHSGWHACQDAHHCPALTAHSLSHPPTPRCPDLTTSHPAAAGFMAITLTAKVAPCILGLSCLPPAASDGGWSLLFRHIHLLNNTAGPEKSISLQQLLPHVQPHPVHDKTLRMHCTTMQS
jgi:hypothetical protein